MEKLQETSTYAPLIDPKVTAEVLRKYGFSMNKRFGQNFLIDAHVLNKIIEAAELTKEDTVLEIGPGIGTMTQALSEAAGKVIAVEIDSKLIPIQVKQAEANAQIAIAKAKGEAEATRVKADAEAYYNRTISASLSNLIIQEDWIEKWNGELPTVTSGNGGMMINLPALTK